MIIVKNDNQTDATLRFKICDTCGHWTRRARASCKCKDCVHASDREYDSATSD